MILDMTPDGDFREPPRPGLWTRGIQAAFAVAALGAAVLIVLVVLWFALIALAIGVVVALVAWAVWSWRVRARA